MDRQQFAALRGRFQRGTEVAERMIQGRRILQQNAARSLDKPSGREPRGGHKPSDVGSTSPSAKT